MMKSRAIHMLAVASLAISACQPAQMAEDIRLTAFIADSSAETRTAYDVYSGQNSWETGDEIAVFLSDGQNYNQYATVAVTPVLNSETGLAPTGTVVSSTTSTIKRAHFAVYPATAADPLNYTESALKVNLPAAYDIVGKLESESAPMPMVASNAPSQTRLDFYHVGGLVRIAVTQAKAETQKVRVTFDKNVTGDYLVADPGTDHPTIASSGTEGCEVLFTVASATLGTATSLVINVPVPCGTYGSVQVDLLGSNGAVLATETMALTLNVSRNHAKKLHFGKLQ